MTFRVLTYSLIALAAASVVLLDCSRRGAWRLGLVAVAADLAVLATDLAIGFST